jgi:hypothetical protein
LIELMAGRLRPCFVEFFTEGLAVGIGESRFFGIARGLMFLTDLGFRHEGKQHYENYKQMRPACAPHRFPHEKTCRWPS